jgi:hypothetical protein
MIDRTLWTKSFSKSHVPAWPCPACDVGTLRLVPESLRFEISRASREAMEGEYWEIEWTTGRYSCLFQCRMTNCVEIVSSAGRFGVEEFYDQDGSPVQIEGFTPEFFSPSPPLFRIPVETPDDVAEEIRRAFQLFWTDKSASANRIRSALELLVTERGVKRFTIDRTKGKRQALKLHNRIDLFRKQEPEIAESLLAVKWLGNAGSHGTEVTADDIFDAMELLQHTLEELYGKRTRRLTGIRKQINQRKGPRKRK